MEEQTTRAFPLSDYSTTVETSNHNSILSHFAENYSTKDWRVVLDENEYWIQVDKGTDVHAFLEKMLKAVQEYPVLNEQHHCDLEYAEMLNAVTRIAHRTGTIIVSNDDALDYLHTRSVCIEESSPNYYTVVLSDDEFKMMIEEEFPHWKEY